MTDAVTLIVGALSPLAGVVVGSRLSRGKDRDTWRRDQRTETYAATLLAARKLQHQLDHSEAVWREDPNGRGPLGWDEVLSLTEQFEHASATTQLFAGPRVAEAVGNVLGEIVALFEQQPGELDLDSYGRAVNELSTAMQRELDPAPRNINARLARW